jgi:hypothetical protein
VVFLVGENPTGGVSETALRDSLDEIAWLTGWKPHGSPAPKYLTDAIRLARDPFPEETFGEPCSANSRSIRIVGPTFSGSADSMRNTLTEWLGVGESNPAKICIVSGTATAVGQKLEINQPNAVHASSFIRCGSLIRRYGRSRFPSFADLCFRSLAHVQIPIIRT